MIIKFEATVECGEMAGVDALQVGQRILDAANNIAKTSSGGSVRVVSANTTFPRTKEDYVTTAKSRRKILDQFVEKGK